MHAGSVGPASLSHRPAGHTGLDRSPRPHLGREPGRIVTVAAALAPHGPKAPQRWLQGSGLVCAACGASAGRLDPGWGW